MKFQKNMVFKESTVLIGIPKNVEKIFLGMVGPQC